MITNVNPIATAYITCKRFGSNSAPEPFIRFTICPIPNVTLDTIIADFSPFLAIALNKKPRNIISSRKPTHNIDNTRNIVSNGENEEANNEWRKIEPNLATLADIDINAIYHRLGITNPLLLRFLLTSQEQIKSGDIDGLKETIIKREVHLKGATRAKTKHVGEFDNTAWFGGRKLDYRFPDAQTIINDIFEGEKDGAESK